jgi:hypothetical protein
MSTRILLKSFKALSVVTKNDVFARHKVDGQNRSISVQQKKQKVVRDQNAWTENAQMGWSQVEKILEALPQDGNLLVWGLGVSSFKSRLSLPAPRLQTQIF